MDYQELLICLFSRANSTLGGDTSLGRSKWIESMQDELLQFREKGLDDWLIFTKGNMDLGNKMGLLKQGKDERRDSSWIDTVYKDMETKWERAATIASSLEAERDSGSGLRCQDTILGGTEAQIRFEAASKQSNDPSLSRVNTLRSGDDIMKLKELMKLYTIFSKRILDIKTDRFWASAKAKIINGEREIQALVDKKKVIITETSIRSDLKLDDAEGIDCLPTTTIFAELERMGAKTTVWNEFSSTMASTIIFFLDKQVKGMTRHKEVYVTPFHTKKVFANMKRPGKGFSGRVTPLFPTMMIQALEDMEPVTNEAHVSTPSYDPPQSGEDSLQLSKLINLCTSLQEKVLDLEKNKTAQAKEIASLKKRVKQLEKRRKSRTSGLRRLRKVGSSSRVESSINASLGTQEDASKQGRKIEDLDADADVEVTLVNENQEMNDDNLMFDTCVLEEQEIEFEKVVAEPVVSVATTTKSI
ncbi:hypothetical protein Tco_0655205, partial [Tanacetum coccineum]